MKDFSNTSGSIEEQAKQIAESVDLNIRQYVETDIKAAGYNKAVGVMENGSCIHIWKGLGMLQVDELENALAKRLEDIQEASEA